MVEIQVGGAIRENLSRFTERFSWAGNRPGRQGTYFLFTDNFFTMSSPATYTSFRSLGQRRLSPLRRENLVPRGNLADNANSLSPIFPPLHSTCLSPMATQVNKGACGTMVSLMTVFVKLSALPVLRPFKKPCPSVLSSDYCSLSEKLSSLLTTLKLFTPNFSWPSASFGGQLWAMGIGQ